MGVLFINLNAISNIITDELEKNPGFDMILLF